MLNNYRLIDFGLGRRLESIDGYTFDRPCPAADWDSREQSAPWDAADAVFDDGSWTFFRPWPESLSADTDAFRLNAQPKPFGHIGLFPEQAANWRWLQAVVGQIAQHRDASGTSQADDACLSPCGALNLFGYTGGSTLALASAGAAVAHVDSAKPSVARAGDNARMSGLGNAPIRYLIDDSRRFTARERRRGRKYSLIALDPPAYGHGSKGSTWRLERDLWPLLEDCLALLSGPAALLVTGHSDSIDAPWIAQWLEDRAPRELKLETGRSELGDVAGRPLDAGFYVRALWEMGGASIPNQ